ncbi:hypothetical protein BC834DRAFT_846478 [Gloeopeniophorella convolvens]|nr:hypothetical protein BC834DRAFT_846478 [Gloeopeniophorella convolvens]
MVILFGHMSRCDSLTRQVALEDVWMALDMLPSFRWRWERKDVNGSHPLIATLAEKVLGVNLRQAGPSSHPVLMPELDWELDAGAGGGSPGASHTPVHYVPASAAFPGSPPLGPAVPPRPALVPGVSTPPESKLAEVPPNLFYPFYPEGAHPPPPARADTAPATTTAPAAAPARAPNGGAGNGADYTQLLAQAAAPQTGGPWGAGGQESYILEEKDVPTVPGPGIMWVPDQRTVQGYVMGPQ